MTEAEKELREERTAIMSVEQIPEADILVLFKNRPDIYGYDDINEVQGELI